MKTMKKIVAILAVALMLCSTLPLSVFAADTEIVFNLGANGSASHADGTSKTTYSETVSGYTLTLSNVSNFYTGARDAKGNSCLKLGASSKAGGFSFTVPADVTSVIIAAGKYKSNTTKLSINGTTHTLTKNSNDGAYDAITVDTTTNKTITLITVSGGYRAMINTITFVVAAGDAGCEHDWVDADCTTPKTCSLCGETEGEALGHDWEIISEEEATCTAEGSATYECAACGEDKVETIPALPHNYVDGFCSVCGEAQPLEITIPVTAITGTLAGDSSSISWQADGFQFITYKSGSTSAIRTSDSDHFRVYAKNKVEVSGQNGALLKKVQFNATTTDYADTLGQQTAEGWTVSVDGTVVTFTTVNGAESLIINSVSAQVRINSVIVTPYVANCEHDYVGVETQAPTCSAEGVMTYTCSKCQESYTEAIATIPHSYVEDVIDSTCTTTGTKTYECSVCFDSYDEVIPKKPHNYVDDVCADCGHVKAYKGTIDFSNAEQRTELTTQIQIWTNEGLTFTNNKLTGNNIADYTDPIRIYKNSGIVIEFPEMAKLIIDANGIGNDYLWDATLEAKGLNYTVANGIYTITFDEAVSSVELTAANQVRANSITAIVAHECVWTDATCTAPKTCSKCGATEGEALGHSYFDDCSAICDVCGYEREVSHNVVHVEAKAATCTEMGNIEYWYCDVCGMAWLDEACTLNTNQFAVKLPVAEHTYDNDFDADCNGCGAIREVASFPVPEIGKSISEDVNGYAVLFDANVEGLELVNGAADYTNATYNGYKLLGLGVTASNGNSETTIEGVRVWGINDETGALQFAFRVINIPADKLDVEITMVPYYTVEIDGVATTIEGEAVVGSYAEIAG